LKVTKLPSIGSAVKKKATSEISEEVSFLPAGKIPFEYFTQIASFFREVSKKFKSEFEAHAWILYSKDRGYFVSVPEQSVSKATVSFSYDAGTLPKDSIIVVDLHSHNTMGAFFSGTDNENDKSGIYYSGVIGKITDKSYEHVIRFNLYDAKHPCKLSDVFDIPVEENEFPKEWLTKVTQLTASLKQFAPPAQVGLRGGNTPTWSSSLYAPPSVSSREKPTLGQHPLYPTEIEYLRGANVNRSMVDSLMDMADFIETDFIGTDFTMESDVPGIGDEPLTEEEAMEEIEELLDMLADDDKRLTSLISSCFDLMTESGRTKIMTHGFN